MKGLAAQYEKVRTNPARFTRLARKYIKKGDAVVDVGCGTGTYFAFLRERVGKEGEVWAVEPNPQMFAAAKKRAKKPGVRLYGRKAEQLSSLGKQFDVIFASLSLQFCDVGKAMVEIRRTLKPGGLLLFRIPSSRPGISNADDAESRKFMRNFHSGVRRRLEKKGLPTAFDFAYVYKRGDAFRKALKKGGFRIEFWKEFISKKSGLCKMLEYYTIPWRSARAMPRVKFDDRYEIISGALREAFARQPKFKVRRYYIVCVARKP